MEQNIAWVNEKKIERTIKALEKNNMRGYLVSNENELLEKIKEILPQNSIVSCGGSVTLFKSGVIELLRSSHYKFLDRYKENLSSEDIKDIYRKAFSADGYFTSSNAITESGELYNVDGTGNRVAAMLYGPDKVIVVAGVNKIVKNVEEAIERNKNICAPANAKRLDMDTPCKKLGYCTDCSSAQRICCEYTIIKKQRIADRIHVILLNENLGY